ncbi:hypothetical protein BC936DRAFT_145070 [Jimgerdemannia flammicorona]|uniref:Palmitoyltransferase n=1 Tax=Jimgerdemannia flammicorona TaxID=994334 RepID=A0A433DAZ9_9FUNG|nr:hypothetical protein BC936DRAFT_145070 [Jimgerdemannia flammicorona]
MAKTLFAVVFGYTLPLLVFFIFGYTWYVYTIRLCGSLRPVCIYPVPYSPSLWERGSRSKSRHTDTPPHTFRPSRLPDLLPYFTCFLCLQLHSRPNHTPGLAHGRTYHPTFASSSAATKLIISLPQPPTPYHSRHPPSSDHLSDPSASDTSDPPPTSRLYNAPTLSSLTTRSRGYSPATFNLTTMEPKPDVNVAITMPTVSLCKNGGQPRFCDHCRCIKPDRAHHCRDCDACVLKMDHHCPWYIPVLLHSFSLSLLLVSQFSPSPPYVHHQQDKRVRWLRQLQVLLPLCALHKFLRIMDPRHYRPGDHLCDRDT